MTPTSCHVEHHVGSLQCTCSSHGIYCADNVIGEGGALRLLSWLQLLQGIAWSLVQDEQTESGSPPHLAPLLKPSQQPQQQRQAGRGMRRAAGQPKLPFKQVCSVDLI